MADLLGSMRVEIVGDNSKLDKSIKDSQKNTETFAKKTSSLGKSLSGLFAGIGFAVVAKKLFDLGKQAENLFKVQELAEAKLDQTLIATGNAAGLTADELKRMASGLQEVTTFGDEAIIGAESLLLTFKDIGGDVFPRALESILDVSEAMGQDLKSSTIQIGKALNDPVAGLTALSRVGIQFTEDQKDLIKSFDEAGNKAGAQAIILKELESQFGGVAEAAALTADGINKQLNNSFGDLLETIGSVISEGLTPYRANLQLEVESVNASITAHLIRKKALAGNAELIELLTLRQIEQEKAEQNLAQAQANVLEAENQVLDTRYLSEVQIRQITAAKQAAIQNAQELVTSLEMEVESTTRATDATQRQVIEERNRVQANILLAQGVISVTEADDENTESTIENIEEITEAEEEALNTKLDNINTAETALSTSLDLIKQQELDKDLALAESAEITEARKQAARQTTLDLFSSSLNVIDQLADNAAAAELERLKKSGASEKEIDDKKKELALANAKRERAIGVFDVAVNTASAIVKAFAQLGPIGGAIATGFIASIGIAQTAAIIGAPLPQFAEGGIVPGNSFNGDKVPVLANSGEAIINRADQAKLMDFIKGGSSSGGSPIRVVVNLDKKPIIDVVSNGTKNGTLIIDSRSVK